VKTDLATIGGKNGQELLTALQKQEPGWLDRPIQEIVQMVDIGDVWLQTQRAILKKIPKGDNEATSNFYKSRLRNVRNAGRGWFMAVIHLGEQLIAQGETRGGDRKSKDKDQSSGHDTLIDLCGISKSTAWKYRKVAENSDAVDVAFENAATKDDIPGVSSVMAILGYNNGGTKKLASKRLNADQTMKKLTRELLEVNMVLARLVEHLDQVKSESAKEFHEAIQRTVEIWTAKAPTEFKKLARGIA
jgi:hypothetical protein